MNQPIIDLIDNDRIFDVAPRTARDTIRTISLRAWIGGIGFCGLLSFALIAGGN